MLEKHLYLWAGRYLFLWTGQLFWALPTVLLFSKRKVSETGSSSLRQGQRFLDCWDPQKELIAFTGHSVKL